LRRLPVAARDGAGGGAQALPGGTRNGGGFPGQEQNTGGCSANLERGDKMPGETVVIMTRRRV